MKLTHICSQVSVFGDELQSRGRGGHRAPVHGGGAEGEVRRKTREGDEGSDLQGGESLNFLFKRSMFNVIVLGSVCAPESADWQEDHPSWQLLGAFRHASHFVLPQGSLRVHLPAREGVHLHLQAAHLHQVSFFN